MCQPSRTSIEGRFCRSVPFGTIRICRSRCIVSWSRDQKRCPLAQPEPTWLPEFPSSHRRVCWRKKRHLAPHASNLYCPNPESPHYGSYARYFVNCTRRNLMRRIGVDRPRLGRRRSESADKEAIRGPVSPLRRFEANAMLHFGGRRTHNNRVIVSALTG